ncbi:MAG: hypothetical protein AB7K41_04840 [Bdellovibrionales bacterium]
MEKMAGQFSVELVGEIVVARITGNLTLDLLLDLSEEIRKLVKSSRNERVLIDALEMSHPSIEVPRKQWELSQEKTEPQFRRAIVVSDARMAYLARLAFGEGDYKVFYSDLIRAAHWLSSQD